MEAHIRLKDTSRLHQTALQASVVSRGRSLGRRSCSRFYLKRILIIWLLRNKLLIIKILSRCICNTKKLMSLCIETCVWTNSHSEWDNSRVVSQWTQHLIHGKMSNHSLIFISVLLFLLTESVHTPAKNWWLVDHTQHRYRHSVTTAGCLDIALELSSANYYCVGRC